MALFKIPPTKTNLIGLKNSLAFAREGHELLDRKRNILLAELMGFIGRARDLEMTIRPLIVRGLEAVQNAVIREGQDRVAGLADRVDPSVSIETSRRRVMGVALPVMKTQTVMNSVFYSPYRTSFWVDDAARQFREITEMLNDLVMLRISVLRLARAVKNTIRKVNALEKIYIPDYSENVKFISERLEEAEREGLVALKMIKNRKQNQGSR